MKIFKQKVFLDIPNLKGKTILFKEMENDKVLQEGEKVIVQAYVSLLTSNVVVELRNDYNFIVSLSFEDSKAFLLGDSLFVSDFPMCTGFVWQLKEPLLDIRGIEREIRRQKLIRKLISLKISVKRFFVLHIKPIFIFLLKCITFLLILKKFL